MTDDQWFPIIHKDRCVGCGACITQCPTQALEQRGGKAALVWPERCIYCADCETLCPHNAIEIPYLVCLPTSHNRKVS